MQMDLDAQEVKIIEKHRADKELAAMETMFQQLCTHDRMDYVGHGHNDDCYKCVACGYTEWR